MVKTLDKIYFLYYTIYFNINIISIFKITNTLIIK